MPNELAYCELFNPNFHGWDYDNSTLNNYEKNLIYTSYLYLIPMEQDEFFSDDYIIEARDNPLPSHPIIRNWHNIQPSFRLEIVSTKHTVGEYTLCIPKTFWLKIIQRKWKKYYHKMMAKRKNPRNLLKREITGKW
jgi:hypothetical protein